MLHTVAPQLDQALVLFGPPKSLTAFAANSRALGELTLDDSFLVHLHYPPAAGVRRLPLTVTVRAHPLSLLDPQPRFVVRFHATVRRFIRPLLNARLARRSREPKRALSSTGSILRRTNCVNRPPYPSQTRASVPVNPLWLC
jgi:hypothetical protein